VTSDLDFHRCKEGGLDFSFGRRRWFRFRRRTVV